MTQLDRASVVQQVEERLAALFEERLSALEEDSLRWLALVPEWTGDLALACGFPGAEGGLAALLERAREAGLCEVRHERDLAGKETVRFWMPSPTRTPLLERLQMEAGPGLNRDIERIAERIFAAHDKDPDLVSAGVLRWAELAANELSTATATGEALGHRVADSLDREDTSSVGEWIFAGESLALALGAEVEMAASRAQRQLNLHYRSIQDAGYLKNFIEREEQMEELHELVRSKDQWALHFIGHSGAGKTMLMRYLTSRSPDGRPITSSARIDFDYIDPRFPLECPARLLYELGVGLAADLLDGTQEALFRSFLEAVTEAEAATSATAPDPLQALKTREFGQVVSAFARFVNSLPQPVVLILDTCEELAKLHPAGDEVPSIAATFDILERVHDEAEEIRVIFAGRRWLTPEAANLVRTEAMPGSVMSMKPRPYMRMHEVRGFTREEVVGYLGSACGRQLDQAMLETVLEITADRGSVPSFGDAGRPIDEPRFNPTDVALLGKWLASDPEISPSDLAGGNLDPYVEERILGRLQDSPQVLAAIPAAILLEQFDSATIWPALGRDSATRQETLNGLLEQEWTHLDGGVDPDEIVIRVDRGLLPRLRGYYERTPERERQLDDARATLAPHLAKLIERAPAGATPDAIDAALRLLPAAEAVRRFDRMASRVAAGSKWSWAEEVCARLLSPEREPPLDPVLEPSVGALYVASLRHRSASVNLRSLWVAVGESAHRHPEAEQQMALEARAGLGVLAAVVASGAFGEANAVEVLRASCGVLGRAEPGSALPSALLATAEALVDAIEVRGQQVPPGAVREALDLLFDRFAGDEPLQAFVLALDARLRALCGEWSAAREAFERIELLHFDRERDRPGFADWVPPASIGHRILLELLRFRLALGEESEALLGRCEKAALERRDGADSAQLLSLALQARLAYGRLGEERVGAAWRVEISSAEHDLTTPAHRAAPPLFVSVAEGLLATGHADWALRLLAEREQAAASRRTDEDSTRAATLATVRILRRLRLRDRLALVASFSTDEDEELRAEGLAAGALIAGLQPPGEREPGRDHAAWRARNLLGSSEEDPAPKQKGVPSRPARGPYARLHVALDRLEGELVRQEASTRLGSVLASRRVRQLSEAVDEAGLRHSVGEPLGSETVRVGLRLSALLDDFDEQGDVLPVAGRDHLLGRIALEEGELLALRLPRQALVLLRIAEEKLAAAGDAHAAFVAALRLAIAEVHAGRPEAALSRHESVLARYEAARIVDPGLPPPGQAGRAEGRGALDSAELWQAWLQRLAAYLEWCEGGPSVPLTRATLGREPELALTPVRRELHTLPPPVSPVEDSEAPVAAPNLEGLDIALALAPRHARGGSLLVEARVTPWRRRLLAALAARLRGVLGIDMKAASFGIGELGERGSPSPLAELAGSSLEVSEMPIRLDVSTGLAQVCWEHWLIGHLAVQRDWEPRRMPEIWRGRPRGYFAPPIEGWPGRIVAVCSPPWRPLIASQTRAATHRLIGSTGRGRGPERQRGRAAIALGLPVMTRAGWRLRLDDDELSQLDDPSRPRSQQLLSADRLVREAPIVIVVGRPGGPRLAVDAQTGNGLRGFANETFLAGARVVISVPVLPPRDAAEVIALLADEIAAWPRPPSASVLRELVRRLRSHLYYGPAGPVPAEEAEGRREERVRRAELALDVCLFAPP